MKSKIVILLLIVLTGCKANKTVGKKNYSYEKDTYREVLHGPVKELRQFGNLSHLSLDTEDDLYKYYTASFIARRFNRGGAGWFKYDTLGLTIWRQSLKDSINQRFIDTLRAHRMYFTQYAYDKEDGKEKLQYTQIKQFPWFVHNPYRVKLKVFDYQPYEMKKEKDSTYKELNTAYKYYTDKKGKIVKEEMYYIWDKNLDGIIDQKDLEFTADYIYNDNIQLITKQYKLTPRYGNKVSIHDFSFDDIPKQYQPKIEYKWDDRGNLIEVKTRPDKDRRSINHLEQYWYDDKNQLVKMRRLHPETILRAYNRHIRNIYDLYFDERGNVIKIESIDDDRKTVHATYLYDYGGYDKYNNWTISHAYLPGKKDAPFLTTQRIISYYEK